MDPFKVFEVAIGPGLLGMSRLPGLAGNFLTDIEVILDLNPTTIISLTEKKEMKVLGSRNFISSVTNEKISWLHFPIKDFGIVEKQQEVFWELISKNIRQQIDGGGRILIHCRGGCGRTGMIVLRVMIEFGEDPDKALKRLRKIRPCAVETKPQETWARSFCASEIEK